MCFFARHLLPIGTIVHKKPRYSLNQGSIEMANKDEEQRLVTGGLRTGSGPFSSSKGSVWFLLLYIIGTWNDGV
jgi:hypothetical protein